AADVREYWTRERMRAARPVGLPGGARAGATPGASAATGPAGNPIGKSAAVEQPNTTEYPNRTVGKVFFTLPGEGGFACSAAVINTDTDRFVLTARHCVEDGGTFASNWMFAPGYRNGAAPFGEFAATELRIPSFPPGFSLGFDHAAAILAPSASGQSVEDAVGGLGIALFEAPEQSWRAYGYPAVAPFDGERLFTCDSPTVARDLVVDPPPIGISCDMTGGSSGGPWAVRGNLVAANTSYTVPDEFPGILFAPLLQTGAAELLDAAHPVRCGGRPPSIVGTEEADRLVGTSARDVILGDRGTDVIIGKRGNDRLCGEEGKDRIKGGGGRRDRCDGGPARDRARSGCEKRSRL
ncbi:MAG: hypothetical protein ACRDL3_05000, partial [Solirubrobacterales bacterium]